MHVVPPFFCKDGTWLSVQASDSHYCTPKNNDGPYTHMEVMSSIEVAGWEEYDDGNVYGYVPVELIEEVIDRCGGVDLHHTIVRKDRDYDN